MLHWKATPTLQIFLMFANFTNFMVLKLQVAITLSMLYCNTQVFCSPSDQTSYTCDQVWATLAITFGVKRSEVRVIAARYENFELGEVITWVYCTQSYQASYTFSRGWSTLVITFLVKSRAVPNRGSWLFSRVRIIKIIIWPNTNRVRIDALSFEAVSLSFIIVNTNIVILDIHSCSASSVH